MESVVPGGLAVEDVAAVTTADSRDSQRVLSNSLVVMTRQGFLWGLNSILILFLPRYLGAEGMGQLSFMLSFTALVAVGISLGSGKFITKAVARDTSAAQRFFGAAVALRLLMTIIGVAITVIVVEAIGYEADLKSVLYVGTGSMVAVIFARQMVGFLHGFEDMKGPARAEIASKILAVAAGIPVLILTSSVVAYVAVLLGAHLIMMVLSGYYLRKRITLGVNFHRPTMRTLFMGGLPFLMMVVILELYAHADVIILRAFTNDEVTGWYGAALQFYRAAELFPAAITTALLPTLSRLHKSDVANLAAIARKSIGVVAAVVLPISLVLSLLAGQVIELMPYPAEFDNSIVVLSLLALTIPITAFLTVLGTIAVSVDRQRALAWALAATLLVDILLNIALIPYFEREYGNGGIGAAITTLAAELVMVAIALKLMPPGMLDRKLKMMLGKIVVAAAVLSGIGLLSYPMGINPIATVSVGALVYIGLVFAMKVYTVNEVRHLANTLLGRRRPGELAPEEKDQS